MSDRIATDFDDWLVSTFTATGPFTMLIVLVGIGELSVDLLRSAHLHVMGDATRWPEMAALFDAAGVPWSGVALFRAGREGLVGDAVARARLHALVASLREDRRLIRDGEFFDRDGLRLALEEVQRH